MIYKLPTNIKDKELTEYLFGLILEYIEIWDDPFQISLAISIYNLFKIDIETEEDDLLRIHNSMSNIINPILKFCMKIISQEIPNVKLINI